MQLLVMNKINPLVEMGLYHRGDIVVVRPDAHEWGLKETLPNFVVCDLDEPVNSVVLVWEKKEDTQDHTSKRILRRRFCIPSEILDRAVDGRVQIQTSDILCKHGRQGSQLQKLLTYKKAHLVEGET